MNCPNCQRAVDEGAPACPHCATDLVDVTIGEHPASEPAGGRPPSWLVFGGVAAAVLAVGLTAWALVNPATSGAQFAARFPADAVAYVEIDVAELASQDTRSLVEAFGPLVEASTGEPFDLDTLIEDALAAVEADLGDLDLSFGEDVASWATGPVAFAALPGGDAVPSRYAVLVGGDDADALDAFLAKAAALPDVEDGGVVEVAGVTLHRLESADDSVGLVGRHGTELIVASDEEAAGAVIAPTAGATLADEPDVSAQMSQLPDNAAVVFAVNGAETFDALDGVGGMLGLSGMGAEAPLTGWTSGAFTTDRQGFRVDYVTDLGETPAPVFSDDLVAALPADTIAFLRMGSLLDQVTPLLDLVGGGAIEDELGISVEEALAVFEVDGAFAIWPSTDPELPVNGALVGVAETSQAALVDRIATLAQSFGLTPTAMDGGYSFNGLAALGTRDVLTILSTDADLVGAGPSHSFAQGDLARRSTELVDGEIVAAVDVPAVIDLVDGLVGMDDPETAELLRCLPLGVAAAGVTVAGDTLLTTTFLEVAERC